MNVMRLAAGGPSGVEGDEYAVRYAVKASMSSSPTRGLVPWVRMLNPSPPPARKLLTVIR
jgi:hypothetical protein